MHIMTLKDFVLILEVLNQSSLIIYFFKECLDL